MRVVSSYKLRIVVNQSPILLMLITLYTPRVIFVQCVPFKCVAFKEICKLVIYLKPFANARASVSLSRRNVNFEFLYKIRLIRGRRTVWLIYSFKTAYSGIFLSMCLNTAHPYSPYYIYVVDTRVLTFPSRRRRRRHTIFKFLIIVATGESVVEWNSLAVASRVLINLTQVIDPLGPIYTICGV